MARKAAARVELARFGLNGAVDDPVQTLLRLITQTRQRVELYASLLQRQYEEASEERAPGIVGTADREHDPDDPDDPGYDDVVIVKGPRIPRWVAGVIGFRYAAAGKDGHIYATSEGVRALVELEQSERRILADLCVKAIKAGIAERQVRLAEQQGALLVQAVRAAVELAVEAGAERAQLDLLLGVMPQAMRQIEAKAG